MMEAFLVPERTVVNAKGDGPALDVSRAEGRIFLLTLAITNIIEQESLDVSIFGSAMAPRGTPSRSRLFRRSFIARKFRCCSI